MTLQSLEAQGGHGLELEWRFLLDYVENGIIDDLRIACGGSCTTSSPSSSEVMS
jgi:hypothetical protein